MPRVFRAGTSSLILATTWPAVSESPPKSMKLSSAATSSTSRMSVQIRATSRSVGVRGAVRSPVSPSVTDTVDQLGERDGGMLDDLLKDALEVMRKVLDRAGVEQFDPVLPLPDRTVVVVGDREGQVDRRTRSAAGIPR